MSKYGEVQHVSVDSQTYEVEEAKTSNYNSSDASATKQKEAVKKQEEINVILLTLHIFSN